ncbi:MAG: CARDB domain-containing protein [bacterium]|nr:CARDB domain-containing protein [bacterium]
MDKRIAYLTQKFVIMKVVMHSRKYFSKIGVTFAIILFGVSALFLFSNARAAEIQSTKPQPVPTPIQIGSQNQVEQNTGQLITIATVNIYNAKIDNQDQNKLKLSFDLFNRQNAQPQIKYAVQLVKAGKTSQTIADEKIYLETLSLNENQTIKKEIEYLAPDYLNGQYQVWIIAKNESGMMLALGNAGTVEFKGSGKFVEIDESSCYLKVENEKPEKKYTLRQGVDIKPEEKLIGVCNIINHFAQETTATPAFETFFRSTFGEKVEDNQELQSIVTLKSQEKKTIEFVLPKAQSPQAYDAVLSLKDEQNKIISNQAVFHYVLHGQSASIQNIRLDKDYYAKNETAKISFNWTPSADSFPDSRLGATELSKVNLEIAIKNSEGQACADPFQKELTSKSQNDSDLNVSLSVPITNDCVNPNGQVVIKDQNGKILDQQNFGIQSASSSIPVKKETPLPVKTILVFIGIGALLAALAVIFIKKKSKLPKTLIFILIFSGALFFGKAETAKADTLVQGNTTYTFNLNKANYAPGETIVISAWASRGGCYNSPTPSFLGVKAQSSTADEAGYAPLGSLLMIFTGNIAGGDNWYTSVTATAPSQGGNYFASFRASDKYVEGLSPGDIVISTGQYHRYFDDYGEPSDIIVTYYVVANYAGIPYQVPQKNLTVTKNGTGAGTVSSNFTGINCGATCSANYNLGTSITLTAVADTGSTFTSWSGCDSVSGTLPNQTCNVIMNAAKNVVATFNLSAPTSFTLSVNINTSGGTGNVSSNPAGINCGAGADCSENYNSGTSVTLTATPDAGSAFAGWSGNVDCIDGQVTMDASKICAATFNQAPVVLLPTYVISPPSATKQVGQTQQFIGWYDSDGPSGSSVQQDKTTSASWSSSNNSIATVNNSGLATCSVAGSAIITSVYSGITATASFTCTAQPAPTSFALSVQINTNGGTGTVTSNPIGINCGAGADCSENYNSGTSVTLTATPDVGSAFAGWSGDADCSDGQVTMNASKICAATFNQASVLPDLIPLNPSASSLVAGNSLSFSATIKNQGAGAALGSQTTAWLDIGNTGGITYDVIFPLIPTSALNSNASTVVTWPNTWIATAGTHRLRITADSTHIIPETNNTNNILDWVFTVGAPVSADFSVLASNDIYVTLTKGGSGSMDSSKTTVSIFSINGFNQDVSLSASSAIAGAVYNFTPQSLASNKYNSGSKFLVSVPNNATPGIYPVTVTGNAGGIIRTVTVNLNVETKDPIFIEI